MSRILITGAGGFIGFHIAQALLAQGHEVIGGVRPNILRKDDQIKYIDCDFFKDTQVETWLPRLKGVEVVINAVGVITQRGKATFQRIHVETPKALFTACQKAGVRRVINISALGIQDNNSHQIEYLTSKNQADKFLMSLPLEWLILRASWLYGAPHKSSNFILGYSALPFIPLMGGGKDKLQPLHITDFTRGVAWWTNSEAPSRLLLEVGGPEQITFREMLLYFRQWLGLSPTQTISLPYWWVYTSVRLMEFFHKSAMNSASIQMLRKDNVTDDDRFWRLANLTPRSLCTALKEEFATLNDHSIARYYFLKEFWKKI